MARKRSEKQRGAAGANPNGGATTGYEAELLREHLPDVEVWACGSRITGESHDGSDLDSKRAATEGRTDEELDHAVRRIVSLSASWAAGDRAGSE